MLPSLQEKFNEETEPLLPDPQNEWLN